MTQILVAVLVIAVLAVVARVAWTVVRFARLPRQAKRHYPLMLWHKFRWRWLCPCCRARLDRSAQTPCPPRRESRHPD